MTKPKALLPAFVVIARRRSHEAIQQLADSAQGSPIEYRSPPNWPTYAGLLAFAETLKRDLADLRPRDMIDIQSFIWGARKRGVCGVTGSPFVPAAALRHAHIFECPSEREGVEVFEAVFERDGTGWFG
jgi:hypothetical protein